MITAEREWLTFLKHKKKLSLPLKNTLILSPHPDDETLGVGGLIYDLRKHNLDVTVVAVTDGENAYANTQQLGPRRQKEQQEALIKLGVTPDKIIRLQLEDSAVATSEDELERLLSPLIDKEVNIIAPWIRDFHPDHEAVGRVAFKLAQKNKLPLTFYFFWTWHHARIEEMNQVPLSIYPLARDSYINKQEAIACYNSQLAYEDQPPILPEQVLTPARRSFEVYSTYDY